VLLLETDDTYVRGLARACGAHESFVKPVDPAALLGVAGGRPRPRPDVSALVAEREAKVRSGEIEADPNDLVREFQANFLEGLIDPRLGVFNRTYVTVRLLEEYKKTLRYGTPLVVAVLTRNQSRAEEGDEGATRAAMAQAASTLLLESRDSDVTGVLDERRFLLLLTCTGIPGATTMLRRVMSALRRALPDGPRFHAGIVTVPHPDHGGPADAVDAAAKAAQRADDEGRDIVEG
jgi:PleD family two-component response regulator